MRRIKVVIPNKYRKYILEKFNYILHIFGVKKMKASARSICFLFFFNFFCNFFFVGGPVLTMTQLKWPTFVQCNKVMNNPAKIPIHQREESTEAYERVHVDYAGPINSIYYLVTTYLLLGCTQLMHSQNDQKYSL